MAYTYRYLTQEVQDTILAERYLELETEHYTRMVSMKVNSEVLKVMPAGLERDQLAKYLADDMARVAILEKVLSVDPTAITVKIP